MVNSSSICKFTVSGRVVLRLEGEDDFRAKTSIGTVTDRGNAPLQGVTIAGREILIAKPGCTWFATGNICTHDRCWLSDGRIIGENVQCPCHGLMFSLRTGEVMHWPATDPVPVYRVSVEDKEVFIEL